MACTAINAPEFWGQLSTQMGTSGLNNPQRTDG